MADDYGTNVYEAELPEVWKGVHGRRLIREEGRPLSGAVWELPPGSRFISGQIWLPRRRSRSDVR
jgi:hypothetical protein